MGPSDKARRGRIQAVCDREATPSGGIQRQLNAAGLSPRSASTTLSDRSECSRNHMFRLLYANASKPPKRHVSRESANSGQKRPDESDKVVLVSRSKVLRRTESRQRIPNPRERPDHAEPHESIVAFPAWARSIKPRHPARPETDFFIVRPVQIPQQTRPARLPLTAESAPIWPNGTLIMKLGPNGTIATTVAATATRYDRRPNILLAPTASAMPCTRVSIPRQSRGASHGN